MHRLICIFVILIEHKTGFLMMWVICKDSCRVSAVLRHKSAYYCVAHNCKFRVHHYLDSFTYICKFYLYADFMYIYRSVHVYVNTYMYMSKLALVHPYSYV